MTPASRVFVLFIDAPSIGLNTETSDWTHASVLDDVADKGCSGFLTLSEINHVNPELQTIASVLGVGSEVSNHTTKFPYPTLPIAFFSTSRSVSDEVAELNIKDSVFVSSSTIEEVLSRMDSLLLTGSDPKAKLLVFFHLTLAELSSPIYAFVTKLLASSDHNSDGSCFISLLRTARRRHTSTALHPLRPRQSFERHLGNYTDEDTMEPPRRLLFSSYHYDRTRRDNSSQFEEEEIQVSGAYGTMNARIFMKEMAFRLGYAPKYGA